MGEVALTFAHNASGRKTPGHCTAASGAVGNLAAIFGHPTNCRQVLYIRLLLQPGTGL